jgi:iron complex transport system ATP-binding protein
VTLDGQDISRIAKKQLARRVAFVEQHGMTDANMRVRDVVAWGGFRTTPPFQTGARTMTKPSPPLCSAWICWIKATRDG